MIKYWLSKNINKRRCLNAVDKNGKIIYEGDILYGWIPYIDMYGASKPIDSFWEKRKVYFKNSKFFWKILDSDISWEITENTKSWIKDRWEIINR